MTHRGIARSFAVVTASTAGTAAHEPDATDLTRIATAVDTLVLLMAAGRLAETAGLLIDAGRDADEPAALVMWATTPEERTVIGTLTDLPALAAARQPGPTGHVGRGRGRRDPGTGGRDLCGSAAAGDESLNGPPRQPSPNAYNEPSRQPM